MSGFSRTLSSVTDDIRDAAFDVGGVRKVGSVTELGRNDPTDIHLSACQERTCPGGITPMMAHRLRVICARGRSAPGGFTARCPPGRCNLSRRAPFGKGSLSIEGGDLPFELARTPIDRPQHADERCQSNDDQRDHLRRLPGRFILRVPSCGCEFAFGAKTTEPSKLMCWHSWLPTRSTPTESEISTGFGDYAIAHPIPTELDPRTMRMSASIRYTTSDEWLILKGRNVRARLRPVFRALASA